MIILTLVVQSKAQSDVVMYGYIKDLGMYYKPVDPIQLGTKTLDKLLLNQVHNRLNFRWYTNEKLTFAVEARNRIYFGQMIREFPEYESIIDTEVFSGIKFKGNDINIIGADRHSASIEAVAEGNWDGGVTPTDRGGRRH